MSVLIMARLDYMQSMCTVLVSVSSLESLWAYCTCLLIIIVCILLMEPSVSCRGISLGYFEHQ